MQDSFEVEADKSGTLDGLNIGLDVLKCFSENGASKNLAQVAEDLRMNIFEVRALAATLERRGYIACTGAKGYYHATSKLADIGRSAPVIKQLLKSGPAIMEWLCSQTLQSCNLAVPSDEFAVVVANAHSPGPCCVSVPLGFRYNMSTSSQGLVLRAFGHALRAANSRLDAQPGVLNNPDAGGRQRLAAVAEQGYAQVQGPDDGVADFSFPIIFDTQAVGALTIPYFRFTGGLDIEGCLARLSEASQAFSATLNGLNRSAAAAWL